jgi:fatty acid desaturase
MQAKAIPVRLNLFLGLTFMLLQTALFFLAPLWLPGGLGLLMIAIAILLTTSFWALIHEAIHGLFHPHRGFNFLAGRLMSISFGGPFRLFRFGHSMHHAYNRTIVDRTEVYSNKGSSGLFRLTYYAQIFGGLYLAELFSSLLFWLPKPLLVELANQLFKDTEGPTGELRSHIDRQLLTNEAIWEMRLDGLMVAMLLSSAFWLYGPYWYVLALALLARGMLVSLVDNSFHYGTELDKVRYSYNLAMPAPLARCILNFNHHRIHHRYPGLPWTALPERFQQDGETMDISFLKGLVQQLKGPIPEDRLSSNLEA